MKLAKRVTDTVCLILISSLIATGISGCTAKAAPRNNQTSAPVIRPVPPVRPTQTPVWKWNPDLNEYYDSNTVEYDPIIHAYKDLPHLLPTDFTPVLYPEPLVRPLGLPTEARWNPYTNGWYDSSAFEYDPVTGTYKDLPRPVPSERLNAQRATQTGEEWIAQHRNSTDEVDIAIIRYSDALGPYNEKLRDQDPQKYYSSPGIHAGQEEGGPLEILTGLGVPKLQRLVDRVQWENPLVIVVEIAVEGICRSNSGAAGDRDFEVARWKGVFNDKVANAKLKVDEISQNIASGTVNEEISREKLSMLGIFALPEAYELIINQGNTSLIKYLPDILPLDKMKEYNIEASQTDDETLKRALASCKDYIEIIKTLHAD